MHNAQILHKVAFNIESVMKGQKKLLRLLLATFASAGHVLLEDFPGTGKTTLAKALALSISAKFSRIQFTPDLLPSDILGTSIYNQESQAFQFIMGPIFSNILVADEINRASPRTQSALLEAMAESQVSIDGKVHKLDDPFIVIATQNPVEFHGTYPLPEAQMDRFAIKLSLGYVSPENELEILNSQDDHHPIDDIKKIVTIEEFNMLRQAIKKVRICKSLQQYIIHIVHATRENEFIQMGASVRASLTLKNIGQALAFFDGSDFVSPDHIQELVVPIIAHRLVLHNQAKFSGKTAEQIVMDILHNIPVPT